MLNIQKNVKLSEYSTFKIGGEAREFVEVGNEKEILEALEYVEKNSLRYFILGGGSNVLFDDKGFGGIVIRLTGKGEGIEIINEGDISIAGKEFRESTTIQIRCWGGESLSSLVNFAKDNNLSGMEWSVGIPGTVGGAISGNAGAFDGSMGDLVENLKIFKILNFPLPFSKKVTNYNRKKCSFNYRSSIFKSKDSLVILSAKLNLQKEKTEVIGLKMKEYAQKRAEKQPVGWYGSAGSFFKNSVVNNSEIFGKFEREKKMFWKNERIPAGWLIEEAGLKGEKFGNISVSDVNANFLINNGGGTMEEVLIVAGIIKQKVRAKFGVELQEEVKVVYY